MAEIFQEENAIILAAAEKMVALGSEAAQRSIIGKESKTQEAKGEKILRLLTAYRKKDDLTSAQLESILYCLRQASESNVFPTIDPIVGQNLEYLVQEEGGGSATLIMQNAGSDLPNRSYLNFYRGLTASDDGTRTNVGLTLGTDGYVLTMDSGLPVWLPASGGGHVIFNGVDVSGLADRDNLRFTNGLTASDNILDTDVKWGGVLTENVEVYPLIANDNLYDIYIGQNIAEDEGFAKTVYLLGYTVGIFAQSGSSFLAAPTTTEINAHGHNLTFSTTSAALSATGVPLTITSNGASNFTIAKNGTGLLQIIDNRAGALAVGLEYAVDYSANFTARSLIDKGYADGAYWSLASGGTLTGNNTITGTGYTLKGIWDSLGTTQTNGYGWWLANTTAAANGSQQVSPSLVFEGQGWKTDATAESQSVKFRMDVLPVQGTANPTATWRLGYSINGGAYTSAVTDSITFASSNTTLIVPSLQTNGNVSISGNRNITFAGGNGAISSGASSLTVTTGNLILSQGAKASSWTPALTVTPGAHTSMTASTEFVSNDFVGASQQWLSGTVITQRFNYFRGFTVTGASATAAFTTAYTVYIDPPVVGINAAITNTVALGVNGTLATKTIWVGTSAAIGGSSTQIVETASGALSVIEFPAGATNTVFFDSRNASFTTGNYVGVRISSSVSPTSGTQTYKGLQVNSTINQTGGANGQITLISNEPIFTAAVNVTGYDWNPTTPANITGTHLAFRSTSGSLLIGHTTLGASTTRIHIRGIGNTTGYAIYGETSAGTNSFWIQDNGTAAVGEVLYIGTSSTAGGDRYIYAESSTSNAGLYLWSKGNGQLTLTTPNNGTGNVVVYGHNIAIGGDTRSTAPGDIDIIGNDSSLSGAPGSHIFIRSGQGLVGNANSGNIYVYIGDKAGSGVKGNIGMFSSNTDFDGAEDVIRIASRTTAPSGTIVADHAYLYVEDIAAGNAALHTMTENGDILKLYSVGGWGTPTNTFDRTTFDTTTVTLPQLASRVGALISDLKTLHGFLKA